MDFSVPHRQDIPCISAHRMLAWPAFISSVCLAAQNAPVTVLVPASIFHCTAAYPYPDGRVLGLTGSLHSYKSR